MFSLDDRGLIVFDTRFKFLYQLFRNTTHLPYTSGPPSELGGRLETAVTLEGDGFLLIDKSPFIRLAKNTSLMRLKVASSKDVNLKLFKMSLITGRMIPLLDTSFDIVDIDLKRHVASTIEIVATGSISIYVSRCCKLVIDSISREVGSDCVDHRRIYTTVDVEGEGKLDVTYPKYAAAECLVHQSLHTLSLPPPLLSFGPDFEASGTYTCNMVYISGELWSDFKGGSASWSLDLSSTVTVLKSVKIVTDYTSNGKLSGIVTLRSKYAPDKYVVCDSSANRVHVDDINSILLSDVRLNKSYDCISVVVSVTIGDNDNIVSSTCEVVY